MKNIHNRKFHCPSEKNTQSKEAIPAKTETLKRKFIQIFFIFFYSISAVFILFNNQST